MNGAGKKQEREDGNCDNMFTLQVCVLVPKGGNRNREGKLPAESCAACYVMSVLSHDEGGKRNETVKGLN